MIQIDEIDFIPDIKYGVYAEEELRAGSNYIHEIENRTDQIYMASDEDDPLLVMGVIRTSLLGRPHFWFLLSDYFLKAPKLSTFKTLKLLLELLYAKYPILETYVEESWPEGERFATFGGFTKTDRTAIINSRKSTLWIRG